MRVWGFNDIDKKPSDSKVWFQYSSSSGSEINYGSTKLRHLDTVVEAAGKNGLKCIVNFVNYRDF